MLLSVPRKALHNWLLGRPILKMMMQTVFHPSCIPLHSSSLYVHSWATKMWWRNILKSLLNPCFQYIWHLLLSFCPQRQSFNSWRHMGLSAMICQRQIDAACSQSPSCHSSIRKLLPAALSYLQRSRWRWLNCDSLGCLLCLFLLWMYFWGLSIRLGPHQH